MTTLVPRFEGVAAEALGHGQQVRLRRTGPLTAVIDRRSAVAPLTPDPSADTLGSLDHRHVDPEVVQPQSRGEAGIARSNHHCLGVDDNPVALLHGSQLGAMMTV